MTHPAPFGALRRLALAAACALLVAPLATTAHADTLYPSKPVRFVTNFPAGGPLDILGRALADPLQKSLKQPFVVDNRPGAGGNIGADAVAKSPADGYTVLLSIDTTFTINPHLYASMPFAAKDLKPLMIFSSSGLTFGVSSSVSAKTLPEFVTQSKAEAMTFASAGNGSPGHFAAEIFSTATGAKITHVPYKGNAPAVMALLSNEVQAGILATPGLLSQIQAGKVRPLAVTGRQRSPLLPQVPTVGELGLKDLEFEVLYLAMVPVATPEPVMKTLRDALQSALALPEVKSRLAMLDMVALGETGDVAAQHLESARARYGKIVKSTGMKLD
ncbi:tripartite tricarboxylate transporter substrate binding protein [Variovorax sp. Sphag1AA]|uniref:Bug family tripartite tricarboxylate transporter substrate binding protein n=1 Tax=Variovorax sp. Sphag1AA TaxID=2587027 RepID=UPI00160B9BF2|nr:tripartite tricarboxylate transporter substrate binding protein [Variovorax sp. Sphag1AA]MBB3175759.1 tripartite-type tricarboxylate transporter receptor subunit TctC [Variovorax sp. Sphag1AA]